MELLGPWLTSSKLGAPSEELCLVLGNPAVPLSIGNVADAHVADALVQVPGLALDAESYAM